MAFTDAFDNVQGWFGQLSARERRLLGLMASVFGVLLVFVPMYLAIASIADLEEENIAISDVLQDIQRAEPRLQQEKVEQRAVDRIYERRAPSLGGFLEEQAEDRNLVGLDISDQPEVAIGPYNRRSVRASLSRVQLRPLIEMLAEIRNSSYPIAVERIQLDGRRRSDDYSAKFAVNAYDKEGSSEE